MSSSDLLEKLRADYSRLTTSTNKFTIFDFFVTAFHIVDYCGYEYKQALKAKGISFKKKSLEQRHRSLVSKHFGKDSYKAMRYLANKNKHCQLTERDGPRLEQENAQTYFSGAIGGAPVGLLPIGGSGDYFLIRSGKPPASITALARTILTKWEDYIANHHLKSLPTRK